MSFHSCSQHKHSLPLACIGALLMYMPIASAQMHALQSTLFTSFSYTFSSGTISEFTVGNIETQSAIQYADSGSLSQGAPLDQERDIQESSVFNDQYNSTVYIGSDDQIQIFVADHFNGATAISKTGTTTFYGKHFFDSGTGFVLEPKKHIIVENGADVNTSFIVAQDHQVGKILWDDTTTKPRMLTELNSDGSKSDVLAIRSYPDGPRRDIDELQEEFIRNGNVTADVAVFENLHVSGSPYQCTAAPYEPDVEVYDRILDTGSVEFSVSRPSNYITSILIIKVDTRLISGSDGMTVSIDGNTTTMVMSAHDLNGDDSVVYSENSGNGFVDIMIHLGSGDTTAKSRISISGTAGPAAPPQSPPPPMAPPSSPPGVSSEMLYDGDALRLSNSSNAQLKSYEVDGVEIIKSVTVGNSGSSDGIDEGNEFTQLSIDLESNEDNNFAVMFGPNPQVTMRMIDSRHAQAFITKTGSTTNYLNLEFPPGTTLFAEKESEKWIVVNTTSGAQATMIVIMNSDQNGKVFYNPASNLLVGQMSSKSDLILRTYHNGERRPEDDTQEEMIRNGQVVAEVDVYPLNGNSNDFQVSALAYKPGASISQQSLDASSATISFRLTKEDDSGTIVIAKIPFSITNIATSLEAFVGDVQAEKVNAYSDLKGNSSKYLVSSSASSYTDVVLYIGSNAASEAQISIQGTSDSSSPAVEPNTRLLTSVAIATIVIVLALHW